MTDFKQEYKKWIGWIQSLELEKIINNVKILEHLKVDATNNKYLFKLLLYLSHCADRCCKEKLSKELQIFVITDSICKHLTCSTDKNKLFSALYYIVNCLLNKQHYHEAEVISKYLMPGNTIDPSTNYESSQYYQLATLWHTENFKKLDLLLNNFSAEKTVNIELVRMIIFHLQILQQCDENLCYVFKTSEMYVKKFISFPSNSAFECLLKIFKYLANYVRTLKNLSITESYSRIILIIGLTFFKRNDLLNNSSILSYFRKCDYYFSDAFTHSSECQVCYKLFREFSINLFETNFMSNEIGKSRFKKCLDILETLFQNFGRKNSSERKIIVETVTAIAYSYDTLFSNWEKLVIRKLSNTNITYSDIISMSKYVTYSHSIMENRLLPKSYVCKKCPESVKCPLKKDIYCACVATSIYIKVLTQFPLDVIDDKVFSAATELIKKLISSYYEVNQLGCKNSAPMWDITGKLIFNFGLLTESKYPGELEELYEVLCKEVMRYDGLNCQTNSFGLENPLGTALHRLCTSNFNGEKYREAMIVTAYNALLSTNESRKRKAYDMWVNIKLKLSDFEVIQEITLLECLRTNTEVMKKFGIDINIDDYNLKDVCLLELKYLSQGKGDLITSMKKTLAELESMDSSLHFAQGVFLLSCHVSQLLERENISDYIKKAIQKIRSSKSKTLTSQCMIANLHFYKVVEKLFSRSQAIVKQIDDVKFTVKAFKLLNNKQNDNEMEGVDDIVPTCGGINIVEDKKYAKELLEVLVLWDNCLQNNMNAFVKDWEPQLTLETIVICGEYCRLFKFKNIEEKVWKLAYKLATALEDFNTCIYVTSRSISLRCINDVWIRESETYVQRIKNSTKNMDLEVVAIFWLSLADFYLDCKKVDEGRVLIENVKSLKNYHILTNGKVFIYSSDIQFRNYYTLNEKTSQEQYCQFLVDIHYLLISLYDTVQLKFWKFGHLKYHLFCYEQIFESMYNIIVPMNSLLSYREVSMHLFYGMKIAQTLGMTIRIGQFLKYTCYIDLQRMQLNNCEATLQDLEHILCLDNFQKSMKSKHMEEPNLQSNTRHELRDASATVARMSPTNPGSPELKRKIFTPPDFLEHSPFCECFTCTNLSYQSLSFSCTHLRAQLYSLLKFTDEAEQYFCGACKIKTRLEENDSGKCRQYKSYKWKREQSYIVDVILYMLDFSSFLSEFYPEENDGALALIEETHEIAETNDMQKHCVTALAAELYFQYHFYQLKDKMVFKDIEVPSDIPITLTNQPAEGCITPKQQIEKSASNPRRRKSPPPLAIPVITVDEVSPAADGVVTFTSKKPLPKRSARNVRRKILVDEVDEVTEDPPARRSTRLAKK